MVNEKNPEITGFSKLQKNDTRNLVKILNFCMNIILKSQNTTSKYFDFLQPDRLTSCNLVLLYDRPMLHTLLCHREETDNVRNDRL